MEHTINISRMGEGDVEVTCEIDWERGTSPTRNDPGGFEITVSAHELERMFYDHGLKPTTVFTRLHDDIWDQRIGMPEVTA